MRTFEAEVATDVAFELAEGPLWDAAHDRLLWVDIPNGRVLCGSLSGEGVEIAEEHRFASTAGAAVPTADGGLLVALRDRFATVAPDGTVRTGAAVVADAAQRRFNDGACDPAGRFLVGTMALDDRTEQEQLYRLDEQGRTSVVETGLTLSNGLGWAPDGRTLYHVDSVPKIVWARSYDPDTGRMGPRRQHLQLDEGTPDGLCVDAEGRLWIAVWGQGEVRCYDEDARHVASVVVPAPHTSCPAFVGPGHDRLVITTAREDLDDHQLDAHPLSGHLFLADVGVAGLPTPAWAGHCDLIT